MRSFLSVLALAAMFVGGCASATVPPPPGKADAMQPTPKVYTEKAWDSAWRTMSGWVTGNTPLHAVKMMEDQSSPDNRRKGIYALVERDFGQREPYTKRYRQIAQSDTDFTVRAAAIRALNWSRDTEAVPVFIAALSDQNDLVRWEAAKALSNIPSPTALEPLTRALGNATESKNVRIAAAKALRHYHNLASARALVNTLEGKDFGVAWQARHSLVEITGKDLRYDERAWLAYFTSSQKPLG